MTRGKGDGGGGKREVRESQFGTQLLCTNFFL